MSNTATCGTPAPSTGACRDAAQVVRIVERRELDQRFERAQHFVLHERGVREPLSAVNDAVPHGLDLGDARGRDPGSALVSH